MLDLWGPWGLRRENCRGPGTLHFMELLRFKSHLQSQWGSAAIFRFSKPPQNSNQSQALCTMYTIEAVDIDWDVQAVEVMQGPRKVWYLALHWNDYILDGRVGHIRDPWPQKPLGKMKEVCSPKIPSHCDSSSRYSFSGWKYWLVCDPSRSLTDENWMLRCAARQT